MAEKDPGDRDFIAVSACRYALGRMTYVVGDTVSWLIHQWPTLDEYARVIIQQDVEETFELDDEMRRCKSDHWSLPLGNKCDRAEWERLRRMWRT